MISGQLFFLESIETSDSNAVFRDSALVHPATARPRVSDVVIEETGSTRSGNCWHDALSLAKQQTRRGKLMKKLLLIAVAISGLAIGPAQRSDAQPTVLVSTPGGISFGFPGGYSAYPTYLNYYPYGYYRRPYVHYYPYSYPYSYYNRSSYYRHSGHRTHHRYHRHYRY